MGKICDEQGLPDKVGAIEILTKEQVRGFGLAAGILAVCFALIERKQGILFFTALNTRRILSLTQYTC